MLKQKEWYYIKWFKLSCRHFIFEILNSVGKECLKHYTKFIPAFFLLCLWLDFFFSYSSIVILNGISKMCFYFLWCKLNGSNLITSVCILLIENCSVFSGFFHYRVAFLPHLEESYQEVLPLMDYPNSGIKKGAVSALGNFCCCVHKAHTLSPSKQTEGGKCNNYFYSLSCLILFQFQMFQINSKESLVLELYQFEEQYKNNRESQFRWSLMRWQ